MTQDWRIGVNADDYLRGRDKRLATEERRPTIRKASDLVGPGIDSSAVSITNYNDQLATFNGYYSSAPGATYAPNSTDSFIGTVLMDSTLGGVQRFTSLNSGVEYTRVFLRSPSDELTIAWGLWHSVETVPATAYTDTSPDARSVTALPNGVFVKCLLPKMSFIGNLDTFARATTVLSILRPGVYAGYFWLRTQENSTIDTLSWEFPNGAQQTYDVMYNAIGGSGVFIPLHFYAATGNGWVQVTASQTVNDGSQHVQFNRVHLSRIGDAPD